MRLLTNASLLFCGSVLLLACGGRNIGNTDGAADGRGDGQFVADGSGGDGARDIVTSDNPSADIVAPDAIDDGALPDVPIALDGDDAATDATVSTDATDAIDDASDGGDATDGADGAADASGCIPTGPETCNGIDDDCNGLIDDAIAPRACYSGPVGTSGVGTCHGGMEMCAAGSYGPCVGEVVPTIEVCDGVDNDCNGTADDSVAPRACYTGAAGTSGVGSCHDGMQMCSSGAFGACMGQVVPAAEACDGVDNNCNGSVDDGVAPQACYTGPAGTSGVGLCHGGAQACVGGVFAGACVGQVVPGIETCDGADNNCNGSVDEGIAPQACYTGPAGTNGVGVCHSGTQMCSGGVFGACAAQVVPSAETCNGLDDNCDGTVDEGNPGGGVSCGAAVGACVATTVCMGGAVRCRGTFVAPSPTGAAANSGAPASPLNTINAAIANAVAIGGGADVCVCAVPGGPAATFNEDITMVQGVSVIGGYRCDTWARNIPVYVTRIQDTTAAGVKFLSGISAITALDGMTVLGQALAAGTSNAITVTDSSPTLQDDIATGGAAPTSVGLQITQAAGASAPTVLRGTYTAAATTGGTQTGVNVNLASPNFTTVTIGGGGAGGAPTAATSIGLRCIGCSGTHVTGGVINGGSASNFVAGMWASGALAGVVVTGPMSIFAGFIPAGVASLGRGVFVENCTGVPVFTAASINGGGGPIGERYGVDVTGAACNVTVTGGSIIGCEAGGHCTGYRSTGAASTVTGATIAGATGGATVATYGVRCLAGGCTNFASNTITAGRMNAPGASAGIEINASAPTFDRNNIRATVCTGTGPGTEYYGALLGGVGSPTVTNNVIRDAACVATQQVVRFDKVNAPLIASPRIVNNTIEYAGCAGCGARVGIDINAAVGAPAYGVFNNNIVRNAGAASAGNFLVYETNASSDPQSFLNNDLWDPAPVGSTMFEYHGITALLTAVQVNTMVPTAAATIAADPLLNATWHISALSPCRDTGTAVSAPRADMDGDPRPTGPAVDIGADEIFP